MPTNPRDLSLRKQFTSSKLPEHCHNQQASELTEAVLHACASTSHESDKDVALFVIVQDTINLAYTIATCHVTNTIIISLRRLNNIMIQSYYCTLEAH